MRDFRPTVLFLAFIACGCNTAPNPRGQLHALFDEAWEFQLRENPVFATSVGDHRYDDRLHSVSAEDQERRADFRRQLLGRIEAIDRSQLGDEDRINYDMFERRLRDAIAAFDFKAYLIPITSETGFHTSFARLPSRVPFGSTRDYENYIARLRAFPTYVEQHIALMREGLQTSFTQPRIVLGGYEVTIEIHVVDDASASVQRS